VLTYRSWALEYPVDFTLIYGTPISGYQAPENQTTPQARRGFEAILRVLLQAYQAGALKVYPHSQGLNLELPDLGNGAGSLPEDVLYLGLVGWTRLHGFIMLELFGHLQTLVGNPDAFYRGEMEHLMRSVGLEV
jgi:hypothetical protein